MVGLLVAPDNANTGWCRWVRRRLGRFAVGRGCWACIVASDGHRGSGRGRHALGNVNDQSGACPGSAVGLSDGWRTYYYCVGSKPIIKVIAFARGRRTQFQGCGTFEGSDAGGPGLRTSLSTLAMAQIQEPVGPRPTPHGNRGGYLDCGFQFRRASRSMLLPPFASNRFKTRNAVFSHYLEEPSWQQQRALDVQFFNDGNVLPPLLGPVRPWDRGDWLPRARAAGRFATPRPVAYQEITHETINGNHSAFFRFHRATCHSL